MNPREKVLLLAELFEVDVSNNIQAVLEDIEASEHYKKLVINVEMAKKYQVPYTEHFLKEYEELEINKITSIKDAYISRAKIDYLYMISQPKYFINPIMFSPLEMATSITYIGELPCYYQNKEMTINELITDKSISTKEKIKTVNNVTNQWTRDIDETIISGINHIISNRKSTHFWSRILEIFKRGLIYPIITIIGVALFLTSIFSSTQFFTTILKSTKITSYAFLCFTISLFLFLTIELVDYRTQKKYNNERNYAYSYLKNHASLAVKYFEDATFKIKHVLLQAIKEQREDKTPISRVNNLSNFRKILLIMNSNESFDNRYSDKFISTVEIIKLTFLVLFILASLFYAIMIIISVLKGGVI